MHKDVICDNNNIQGEGQSCIGVECLRTIETKLVLF